MTHPNFRAAKSIRTYPTLTSSHHHRHLIIISTSSSHNSPFPNTSSSTANRTRPPRQLPAPSPLVLVYCPTSLRWHPERRSRRPACTFRDSLIDRTLFLDFLSTLPVSFYFLLVRFTLKPRALTLRAGTTDDSRRRSEYIPQHLPYLYPLWFDFHHFIPLPRRQRCQIRPYRVSLLAAPKL